MRLLVIRVKRYLCYFSRPEDWRHVPRTENPSVFRKQTLLCRLREYFWILKGSRAVKTVLHVCMACQKQKSTLKRLLRHFPVVGSL